MTDDADPDPDSGPDSDSKSDPSPADHDWRVVESVAEYETGWYTGGYDLVELPDGDRKRYYWAELPAAAVVVAVVDTPAAFGLPPVDVAGDETDLLLQLAGAGLGVALAVLDDAGR